MSASDPQDGRGSDVLSKGLKVGALGLAASVVMGIASTAPAYSLASALGGVVGTVGLQSPAIMVLAFVPMILIAIGYRELNKAEPDCGTTFTWATRAFGHKTGWMGGWGIIASDVIVMANLAAIAGSYTFLLFNDQNSTVLQQTVVGVVWTLLMTYIAYRGIEVSARLQMALLSIEVIMLVLFSVVALVKVYSGHGATVDGQSVSIHPSLSWFNPFQISGFGTLAAGLLLATFIYWGWDTAVTANEETKDAHKTPGRAAVISTVLLLVTYALVTVAAQAFAGVGDKGIGLGNPNNAGDVLSGLGTQVFGSSGLGAVLAKLLIFMVLTSSAASAQTSILPTARTMLSMAAFRALPTSFARIHHRWLTPSVSTWVMGGASIIFYVGMTKISSNVLTDTIGSLGLLIAFYYGLTGYACVWFYRKALRNTTSDLLNKGVAPLLGALGLTAMFVYGLGYYFNAANTTTSVTIFGTQLGLISVIGVSTLVLGVVLMVLWRIFRPAFFRGETLDKRTSLDILGPVPVMAGALGLPDAPSQEGLVINPELSGLSDSDLKGRVTEVDPADYVTEDPEGNPVGE